MTAHISQQAHRALAEFIKYKQDLWIDLAKDYDYVMILDDLGVHAIQNEFYIADVVNSFYNLFIELHGVHAETGEEKYLDCFVFPCLCIDEAEEISNTIKRYLKEEVFKEHLVEPV